MASAITLVLGLALIVAIGYFLIVDPFGSDTEEPAPTTMSRTVVRGA
jgi:hypothetical protein